VRLGTSASSSARLGTYVSQHHSPASVSQRTRASCVSPRPLELVHLAASSSSTALKLIAPSRATLLLTAPSHIYAAVATCSGEDLPWSRDHGSFVCHYSGAVLTEDPTSPWHISFDHRTPGDERELVVCAQLVNHFKSNLTEQEFRFVVVQLGECFTGVRTSIDRFQPMHWGRSVKLYR